MLQDASKDPPTNTAFLTNNWMFMYMFIRQCSENTLQMSYCYDKDSDSVDDYSTKR